MWGLGQRPSNIIICNTRVSNTTHIGCRDKLMLGDHVFIGHYNFIDSCNGINIGEGCQVTNYVSILTHSSHVSIRLHGRRYTGEKDLVGYEKGPVEIGPYSFIGPHSVIAAGTRVGKGCLVAAYTYLKGNYPDFSILSGNPTRVAGSTKDLDESHLRDHPELRDLYNIWAEEKPGK